MFTIKDNAVTMKPFTKKLNKQKLLAFKKMSGAQQKKYLLSMMGVQQSVNVPKIIDNGLDLLEAKGRGHILSELRHLKRLGVQHLPTETSLGHWIGVEIECFIPHKDGFSPCGDCPECNDGNSGECFDAGPNWTIESAHDWLQGKLSQAGVVRTSVKADGSLDDEKGHGVELTIVFNSLRGFEPLERLCKVLSDNGCYVNKTCGLHVHLDSRDIEFDEAMEIGKSIGCALPILMYLVAPSRRNNNYCKLRVSNEDRYSAINMTAYEKFKTIEIRLHHGTIDFTKIKNWIEILKLTGNMKFDKRIPTFQEFITKTSLPDYLVEYCDRRITELNPDKWLQLQTEVA